VEDGGGERGGDAKSAEACWKRVFEVDEVGTVESQVRADGSNIVNCVESYREVWIAVKCGEVKCGEASVGLENAMR
jgi:hypothetical protein